MALKQISTDLFKSAITPSPIQKVLQLEYRLENVYDDRVEWTKKEMFNRFMTEIKKPHRVTRQGGSGMFHLDFQFVHDYEHLTTRDAHIPENTYIILERVIKKLNDENFGLEGCKVEMTFLLSIPIIDFDFQ